MSTRDQAVARALAGFDDGGFKRLLTSLVAIPSTSQDPGHEADLAQYLDGAIRPWLERLGFTVQIHPNPREGFGPILLAERIEPSGPTVITYGHGDTVRGLADQWRAGLDPWTLTEEGGKWYGRGSADNKGQHAINLHALEAVLAERGGTLGFSIKMVLETAEERGSQGLRDFVAAHAEALRADVLIASDGPRVASDIATISTGTRGTFHFDLVVDIRPGGVHSGNWGGMTTDPAIVLSHALAAIADRHGRILVPGWLPPHGMPNTVRHALAGLELRAEGEAATIDPAWGEPGLSAAEKVYGWTSFIVLAMVSGRPDNPVNAVAPNARAHCQLRYTVDCDTASVRTGAAGPSGRRRLLRGADPERRHAHARQPHRPGQPVGAPRRRQPGAHAGPQAAADPEQRRRAAGRRVHRPSRRAVGVDPPQLQRLQAARSGRASAARPRPRRHRVFRRAMVGSGRAGVIWWARQGLNL